MSWLKNLAGKIIFDYPLSKLTTFRIGGPVGIFFQPSDIADLRRLLINARNNKQRILIIGAGSNLLVGDKGLSGIVVKLNGRKFKEITFSDGLLKAGAGASLAELIEAGITYGLGGLEFLVGIPGTVGGALVMNAGIKDLGRGGKNKIRSISDLLTDVAVMDYQGNIKVLKKNNLRFDYRWSSLYNYIVLSANFRVSKTDKKEIRNKLKYYLRLRKQAQDYSYPSAGCIFKNPPGQYAGRLIEECGLKGKHFGDAYISSRHANFIVNKRKAKANDVLRLIRYAQFKVKKKFGIDLEPEIKIWKK